MGVEGQFVVMFSLRESVMFINYNRILVNLPLSTISVYQLSPTIQVTLFRGMYDPSYLYFMFYYYYIEKKRVTYTLFSLYYEIQKCKYIINFRSNKI